MIQTVAEIMSASVESVAETVPSSTEAVAEMVSTGTAGVIKSNETVDVTDRALLISVEPAVFENEINGS